MVAATNHVRTAHYSFALLLVAGVVAFWAPIRDLGALAITAQHCSHIPLIPLLTAYLVWSDRQRIFAGQQYSGTGLFLIAAALLMNQAGVPGGFDSTSAEAAALVLYFMGAFISCYGLPAWRGAWGRLLLLVIAIPLPEPLLQLCIHALQRGSAAVAGAFLHLSGIPFMRDGLRIALPGVTIEVGEQCSGIRSSIALLIVSVLAGHLLLRTGWKKVVLALSIAPVAVFKNGLRIATLTLLGRYVDASFLTGRLHQEGGVVFFAVTLLVWMPVLWLLRRSEHPAGIISSSASRRTPCPTPVRPVEAQVREGH